MVSFPPLIDMLKFSGYPYLIRGRFLRNDGGPIPLASPGSSVQEEKIYCKHDRPRTATDFQARPGVSQRDAHDQATLERDNDARTGMPAGIPAGAMCVQKLDDSLNSAIHIIYRISLRSSSMPEPRDPLLKVLFDLF